MFVHICTKTLTVMCVPFSRNAGLGYIPPSFEQMHAWLYPTQA